MIQQIRLRLLSGLGVLFITVSAAAYGPGGFVPVAYNPFYAGQYRPAPGNGYWRQPQRPPVRPDGASGAVYPKARSAAPAPEPATGRAETRRRAPSPAGDSEAAKTATAAAAASPGRPAAIEQSDGTAIITPVVVDRIPDDLTRQTPVAERKQRFLEILTPLVLIENERLARLRHEVEGLVEKLEHGRKLSDKEQKRLTDLAGHYRVAGHPLTEAAARRALLERIDTIPVSLALAQAANESAWGSSRFAREAQNLFGIWTYDESEGIVPKRRSAGKKHLIRRFDSLQDSVRYYMFTLNSHPAYAELRKLRARHREAGSEPSGMALSEGLEKYSAKGDGYVRIIQQMIEENQLSALEDARLAG